MMNAVGGTSLHYWAQSWRLNPWDFKVVSETTRRYGASRIPKGSTVEDWPFGLEELEPYYDKVEYEVGVSGQAGNINGKIDPRGNIFEGPRKRAYPMPPLRGDRVHSTRWRRPRARSAGIRSPVRRRSTRARTRTARRACITASATAAAATSTPRTRPRHDDPARRRRPDGSRSSRARTSRRSRSTTEGRATGVNYRHRRRRVLPAGEGRAARQLHLRERAAAAAVEVEGRIPNGLSNNHGQVGRHYFSHHRARAVTALFPFDLKSWYGLPAQGVAVDNWADDNFDHSGLDFIGGGNLWVYSDRRPIAAGGHEHVRPRADLGLGVESVHQGERRPLARLVPPEDDAAVRGQLPRPRSGREGSARLPGHPHHRGVQGQRAQDRRRSCRTRWSSGTGRRARSRFSARRSAARWAPRPTPTAARAWATTPRRTSSIAGASRTRSPNLGVLGASVMGTSGARNPTLTAQALAWRTAEYIVQELEVGRAIVRRDAVIWRDVTILCDSVVTPCGVLCRTTHGMRIAQAARSNRYGAKNVTIDRAPARQLHPDHHGGRDARLG